jgi:hypothetical protein
MKRGARAFACRVHTLVNALSAVLPDLFALVRSELCVPTVGERGTRGCERHNFRFEALPKCECGFPL